MYYDYTEQSYHIKARAAQLISEAARVRQAQEFRLTRETQSTQKPKKASLPTLGAAATSNR
jgi:hypothetical protein